MPWGRQCSPKGLAAGGARSSSPSSQDCSSLLLPQASRMGAYQPSPDTLSPCLHPSSSPGWGDIAGKQPWMQSICGFGQGLLEGSRAMEGESKKQERDGGGRRIFFWGTRVRFDPQGQNQVETPRTEDSHTAARGELHFYF